jgi:hypothetical protein
MAEMETTEEGALTAAAGLHRQSLADLREDVASRLAGASMAGSTSTLSKTVVGVPGVAKLQIERSDQSYRCREALTIQPDEDVAGTKWIDVNGKTSLKVLQEEFGEKLLGWDASKNEMSIDLLNVGIFQAKTRTARALVKV